MGTGEAGGARYQCGASTGSGFGAASGDDRRSEDCAAEDVRSQAAKRREGCRIANEALTVLFMLIAFRLVACVVFRRDNEKPVAMRMAAWVVGGIFTA